MSGFHYIEFSKTGSILLNAEEKDELFGYLDRLKAENEKLRKLVRKMARALGVCCGWCNASCGRAFECDRDEHCHIEVAMMELGMDAELEELKAEYEDSQSEFHDGTEELGIEVD